MEATARTASTANVPDRNDCLASKKEREIRGATPEEKEVKKLELDEAHGAHLPAQLPAKNRQVKTGIPAMTTDVH